MNPTIYCDICKKPLQLTQDMLEEHQVSLERDGHESHEVVMTWFTCPHCGKSYIVTLDDESTLPLVQSLRKLLKKQVQYGKRGERAPAKVTDRYYKEKKKLNFRRQKLALKYKGSFYQTEDGKEQLDYCYHAQ